MNLHDAFGLKYDFGRSNSNSYLNWTSNSISNKGSSPNIQKHAIKSRISQTDSKLNSKASLGTSSNGAIQGSNVANTVQKNDGDTTFGTQPRRRRKRQIGQIGQMGQLGQMGHETYIIQLEIARNDCHILCIFLFVLIVTLLLSHR